MKLQVQYARTKQWNRLKVRIVKTKRPHHIVWVDGRTYLYDEMRQEMYYVRGVNDISKLQIDKVLDEIDWERPEYINVVKK
jgi:hypothetical protein